MKNLTSKHEVLFKHRRTGPFGFTERVLYIQKGYMSSFYITNNWTILDMTENIMVVETINNFCKRNIDKTLDII